MAGLTETSYDVKVNGVLARDIEYSTITNRYLLPNGEIRNRDILTVARPTLIDQAIFAALKTLSVVRSDLRVDEPPPDVPDSEVEYWHPVNPVGSIYARRLNFNPTTNLGVWTNISYTIPASKRTQNFDIPCLHTFSETEFATVAAHITPCHNVRNTDFTIEFRFALVADTAAEEIHPIPRSEMPVIRIAGIGSFENGSNSSTGTITGSISNATLTDAGESRSLILEARFARGATNADLYASLPPVYLAMVSENSVVRVETSSLKVVP